MKREEAIKLLKQYQGYEPIFPDGETLKHAFDLTDETVDTLLTALCPVSRDRIEKVWKGEWIKERRQTYIPVEYDEQGEVILHDFVVYRCSICGRENTKEEPFCNCGAPMTDAAVLTVMDRLEVLKDDC